MRSHVVRRGMVPLVLGVTFGLVMPAQGFAKAVVRFVHGVPGVGRATVSVSRGGQSTTIGSIAFGQVTRWHSLRAGAFRWTLTKGGTRLAGGSATIGNGAYDIVVLEQRSKVRLGIYRDRGGRSGTSLVRVIHGAPEFGAPALTVDGKVAVKSLAYTHATPYVALSPGTHTLGAVKPGTKMPLVSARETTAAGKAYSAIVLGTRGQQVRVVTLVDRGAPLVRDSSSDVSEQRRKRAGARAGARGSTVMVKPGDSLWSIARTLVGPSASDEDVERRLVEIWDDNERRIGTGDPNLIFPGTRLRV
jgi:LysM repeat protein